MSERCGSRLRLAGKYDRCRWMRGHKGWHRWWSEDARVHVEWARDAGGSRWRYPARKRGLAGLRSEDHMNAHLHSDGSVRYEVPCSEVEART